MKVSEKRQKIISLHILARQL